MREITPTIAAPDDYIRAAEKKASLSLHGPWTKSKTDFTTTYLAITPAGFTYGT